MTFSVSLLYVNERVEMVNDDVLRSSKESYIWGNTYEFDVRATQRSIRGLTSRSDTIPT